MKNFSFLFLIFFLSNFLYSQECKWEWNSPLPQGNDLYEIKFASKDVVYAIGGAETLLKSIDSGLTWKIIDLDFPGYLYDIYNISIIDEDNIALSGENGTLLKSNDGGATWFKKSIPINNYFKIDFMNKDIGYATLPVNSKILKTTDGGDTWVYLNIETNYNICYFLNENNIFIAKENLFIKSTDGGKTWNENTNFPFTPISKTSIYFLNENIGWVSTYLGTLLNTTDGGETWTNQTIDSHYPISFYKFFDENNGYIFAKQRFFKTTNAGKNWVAQYSDANFDSDITSMDIYEDGFVIGIGENGIIKRTTDNGYTWVNLRNGFKSTFNQIQFIDKNTGRISGDNGLILKTTDAGNSWTEQSKGLTTNNIFDLHFFNLDTGVIATNNSSNVIFFKTTNSGVSWFEIGQINDIAILYDVCLYNEQTFWVSVYSIQENFIMKTTNSGEKWYIKKCLRDTVVHKIQFINENIAFAVGEKGVFLKTTDGGDNWNITQIDSNDIYHTLYFINENTGWIGGNKGRLLKTTDGGVSWISQNESANYMISDIQFLDDNNGWAISFDWSAVYSNIILKTIDGGNTWEKYFSPSNKWVFDLCFVDDKNGWIVGQDGILLNYSCTETAVEEPLPISETNDFQIFPNPATNEITFSIPDEQNINSISIFNSLKMEVKRIEKTEIIGNSKITISTTDLPSGLYHCSFVNQGRRVTKSFLVLK